MPTVKLMTSEHTLRAHMIYSFHIFDRHSNCIYNRQFDHTVPSSATPAGGIPSGSLNAHNDSDASKLLFGMLYSLKTMCAKLAAEVNPIMSFDLGKFRVHTWESQTGVKLVIVSDNSIASLQPHLLNIYVQFYVANVVRNPLVSPEFDPEPGPDLYRHLSNPSFVRLVDQYLQALPEYNNVVV